jgi:hypothetical protein
MRFFVFVVLIFVFFNGCRIVETQMNGKNDSIKTVIIPEIIDANDVDIISDLDYIILGAKENSYYGYVSKMRVYKDRIYILDDWHAKSLFIYSIKGKHIATIGDKKGHGPFEFVNLVNFEIDYTNNQILAFDDFGYKFMIYDLDGNFVKRVDSKIPVFDAVLLPNGYFLHAKPAWEYKIPGQSDCQIIIVGENNRIIKEGFEYDDNKNLNIHIFDIIRAQLDGGFNFAPKFRDTIYNVSFESIIPKYAIDYGNNKKIPNEKITDLNSTRDLYKLINEGENMCFMGEHVESTDFLYLSLGHLIKQFYVFYNKTTDNTIAISGNAKIGEYKYDLYSILCSDSEGYFYGAFNNADMDEIIRLFPEMEEIGDAEEMNPILFRYKVKI